MTWKKSNAGYLNLSNNNNDNGQDHKEGFCGKKEFHGQNKSQKCLFKVKHKINQVSLP